MKKIVYILLAIFISISLASCGKQQTNENQIQKQTNTGVNQEAKNQSEGSDEVKKPETVKIGVLAPITGGAASYGEDMVNVFNMIVDEYNKENTPKIELITEDSKCSGKDSVLAYNKLANVDKVEAIAGPICSAATIPAAKITQTNEIPMIAPISSAPEISNIGDYVYRYYNDLDAAETVVKYINNKGGQKIGIIVKNTDYGVGYADAVKSKFNGEILLDEKFDSNEKDFSMLAKKLLEKINDIDFLIFVPNNENTAVGALKAFQNEGELSDLTKNGKLIGSEAMTTDGVIATMGIDFEGAISTKLIDDTNLFNETGINFINEFKSKYKINSSELFVTLEAETMTVITDAIKNGNYTKEGIQGYIKSITEADKRSGLFGDYYFKGADAVGLDFLMGVIKYGKLETLN